MQTGVEKQSSIQYHSFMHSLPPQSHMECQSNYNRAFRLEQNNPVGNPESMKVACRFAEGT